PSVTTLTGTHYALPFWIDKDGNYTCIHSNDLKVYMHWGYRGEFEGNDPDAKAMAKVYDELTSSNYYSEIKYYDLRLDGEPYVYAPLPAAQYNFMDEDTGKEWLRVPVASTISQEVTLSGLEPGNHRFEVRAVDLQNEPDKTPSEFLFKIVSSVPALEKEGILVVDNTPHNQSWAPETITDSLYSELGFLADYTGTIDILDRKWLYDNVYVNRNYTSDVLSPTDLQKYKTIIYHADFYENMNLQSEANALDIYFQGGGNLIISGCANLSAMRSGLQNNGSSFLQKYFGIDYMEDDAIVAFKGAMMPFNPSYFKKAVAHNSSYSDITLDPDGFYSQITLPNFDSTALGPISYFPLDNLSINTEVLFTFGCKDPGDGLYDPSNQEYTFYSQQPVAIKSVNSNNNKCFMFGFPLSYMDEEAVSDMLMQIINDIEQ
nr:hypothetical protein [Candidatus Cloacimonadota bacterium]